MQIIYIRLHHKHKTQLDIELDELAHLLIHPWSEDIDSLPKEEFKLREAEGNVFASAFLLPRSTFGSEVMKETSFIYH